MAIFKKTSPSAAQVVPSGHLVKEKPSQFVQNANNPRRLFDPEPLGDLKDNIRAHGVLVPLTVFRQPGGNKYEILDGARRHRCCMELAEEGKEILIPANVVEPPDRLAGLLYMFSIHNFREGWELMPTALSLKVVIADLAEEDSKKLHDATGLSIPQIERCKTLLKYPDEYQMLSMDPNPRTRIPSNFWIEADPVIEVVKAELPGLIEDKPAYWTIDQLIAKYKRKKIKSVIHFRRIIEALENSANDAGRRQEVLDSIAEYILNEELETRAAFDKYVLDNRKVSTALSACDDFMTTFEKARITHAIDEDKAKLIVALRKVEKYVKDTLEQLSGEDAPAIENE